METLIQTAVANIIYGYFHGEANQELFRCPRGNEKSDLGRCVNEHRYFLGFEEDKETTDLRESDKYTYSGYYRLYFRGGHWYGRWMEKTERVDLITCAGVNKIIDWLGKEFPKGCDWKMEAYLSQYSTWGSDNRYLLKPLYSDHYKVMFDTTYGNGDYPVRIYVYE